MLFHGIEMQGNFKIQTLSVLPSGTEEEEGRIVYLQTDKKLYVNDGSSYKELTGAGVISIQSGLPVFNSEDAGRLYYDSLTGNLYYNNGTEYVLINTETDSAAIFVTELPDFAPDPEDPFKEPTPDPDGEGLLYYVTTTKKLYYNTGTDYLEILLDPHHDDLRGYDYFRHRHIFISQLAPVGGDEHQIWMQYTVA